VGRPEGKRPLARPRRRSDNIKIDFNKWDGRHVMWIDVTQDRNRWRALVNEIMNLQVP
jgi:hypothetical protein